MSTAAEPGEIRYDFTDLGASRSVDTVLWRDAINSALHKADEAAQVRACWTSALADVWAGAGPPESIIYGDGIAGAMADGGDPAVSPRWYRFDTRTTYAPKVRADGRPYPLRVRIAGARTMGATGDGVVDYGIYVCAHLGDFGAPSGAAVPLAEKRYSGITSTVPAWLTPDDASHLIELPATITESAYGLEAARSTLTDIGGDPTIVILPLITIVPFAQRRSGNGRPGLFGFYAAEYVGQT